MGSSLRGYTTDRTGKNWGMMSIMGPSVSLSSAGPQAYRGGRARAQVHATSHAPANGCHSQPSGATGEVLVRILSCGLYGRVGHVAAGGLDCLPESRYPPLHHPPSHHRESRSPSRHLHQPPPFAHTSHVYIELSKTNILCCFVQTSTTSTRARDLHLFQCVVLNNHVTALWSTVNSGLGPEYLKLAQSQQPPPQSHSTTQQILLVYRNPCISDV